MNSQRLVVACSLAGWLTLPVGCASLASMKQENVAFRSNPPDAHVVVRNEAGDRVASTTTPAVVALPRGKGFLRGGPKYTATIEKPGYQTAQLEIKPKVNPWIAGNILFGAGVGLALDSANGAMWRLSPKEFRQDLVPLDGPMYSSAKQDTVAPVSYTSRQKNKSSGAAVSKPMTPATDFSE